MSSQPYFWSRSNLVPGLTVDLQVKFWFYNLDLSNESITYHFLGKMPSTSYPLNWTFCAGSHMSPAFASQPKCWILIDCGEPLHTWLCVVFWTSSWHLRLIFIAYLPHCVQIQLTIYVLRYGHSHTTKNICCRVPPYIIWHQWQGGQGTITSNNSLRAGKKLRSLETLALSVHTLQREYHLATILLVVFFFSIYPPEYCAPGTLLWDK
jgi:hypothetical protein